MTIEQQPLSMDAMPTIPQRADPLMGATPWSDCRKTVVAILLCAVVLSLTFPFYTAIVVLRTPGGPNRVLMRSEHGPWFFGLPAPEVPNKFSVLFADKSKFAELVQMEWVINWSRTIHAFLLFLAASLGIAWLVAAKSRH